MLFVLLAVVLWAYGRSRDAGQRKSWYTAALIFLFLALLTGGIILAQKDSGDAESSTRTRTRRGACELEAEFGLRIIPPRPTGEERDILLDALIPGLYIDSNGNLLLKAKDVRVAPYPGTITFIFRRGASGETEFHRRSQRITSAGDLRQLMSQPAPDMSAPAGISPINKSITERLRIEVGYDPEDIPEDCKPLRGELTIGWRYNASPRNFAWEPMGLMEGRIAVPPHRSRVRHSDGIIDETTGFPGEVNKATHTWVHFRVDEPFACCGQAGRQHTIIQFVRHRWKLGSGPERQDGWNLDGPESQSQRHGNGQDYDPTYTTDPAHGDDTANEDNGLVHVGPWDPSGGSAVIVDDFPGLLQADHDLFLRQGGWFEWEFVTLLVCREERGSAPLYLQKGKVRAKTRFRIRRTYPGNGSLPSVSGALLEGDPEGKPEHYGRRCRDLSEVLDETGLRDAFNNPRPHRLRIQ